MYPIFLQVSPSNLRFSIHPIFCRFLCSYPRILNISHFLQLSPFLPQGSPYIPLLAGFSVQPQIFPSHTSDSPYIPFLAGLSVQPRVFSERNVSPNNAKILFVFRIIFAKMNESKIAKTKRNFVKYASCILKILSLACF